MFQVNGSGLRHAPAPAPAPEPAHPHPHPHADPISSALDAAECIVLDFDGPIASLFADGTPEGSTAPLIAESLLAIAGSYGLELDDMKSCQDPHRIYRRFGEEAKGRVAETRWQDLHLAMRDELAMREAKSVHSATLTPGAAEFIKGWRATGRHLSVASNNDAECVKLFLERVALLDYFDGPIVGRDDDVALMKPHPHALRKAMLEEVRDADRYLLIGDAPSDFVAARAAGMGFIGYHRGAEERKLLIDAGADMELVVATMGELAER